MNGYRPKDHSCETWCFHNPCKARMDNGEVCGCRCHEDDLGVAVERCMLIGGPLRDPETLEIVACFTCLRERIINDVIAEVVEKHENPKPIPVAKEPARIGKRPKDGEQ